MQLCFTVPLDADGILLRSFLRQCNVSSELSRAVKFRGSGYFADGKSIFANQPVFAGQAVSFALPPDLTSGAAPDLDLLPRVMYEDDFAMVLEKPAGIAVHPTLNYGDGTLANGYAALMLQRGKSPVFRAVNRIDKDTSGLVLVAKNAYAAPLLANKVQKVYCAMVQGELPFGEGVIDAPLGRQGESIIGRCVRADGKPSRTEYTVTKYNARNDISLAECVPVTGRTHQIRVHFSYSGHPLAGDDLYGGSRALIARQALHCAQMQFETPCGQGTDDAFAFSVGCSFRKVVVESELPTDMADLICET